MAYYKVYKVPFLPTSRTKFTMTPDQGKGYYWLQLILSPKVTLPMSSWERNCIRRNYKSYSRQIFPYYFKSTKEVCLFIIGRAGGLSTVFCHISASLHTRQNLNRNKIHYTHILKHLLLLTYFLKSSASQQQFIVSCEMPCGRWFGYAF